MKEALLRLAKFAFLPMAVGFALVYVGYSLIGLGGRFYVGDFVILFGILSYLMGLVGTYALLLSVVRRFARGFPRMG